MSFLNLSCLRLPLNSLPSRTFSTSTRLSAVNKWRKLELLHENLPPYPYPPRYLYTQSNFGLYGTSRIRSGHNVGKKFKTKTRRKWRLNVHRKRLWSRFLNRYVRTKVTANILRTIDKFGGLDNYVLGTTTQRIKDLGMGGWAIRWRVMQSAGYKAWAKGERERLGIDESGRVLSVFEDEGRVQIADPLGEDVKMEEERTRRGIQMIDAVLDEDDARAEDDEEGGFDLSGEEGEAEMQTGRENEEIEVEGRQGENLMDEKTELESEAEPKEEEPKVSDLPEPGRIKTKKRMW